MKNNKVKRTILLLLISVILFSLTMVVPAFEGSQWKVYIQGAATGLLMAAIVSIITLIIDNLREAKK
ncbi:hypothetical protein [Mucilaginibacter dorajii]|uniref:Uncharacterized protein n=1 Tax=Mucilaginibacter dorajii TaxID=692994 RepID=A0ABP7P6R9_9SPHI|nr:hypothetical protein [Mucilaginibacter dorajii]MCS3736511.1 uncharacterized membrane protein YcjF (UPF0283 family) [Mucilaginibacter dorajii]